MTFDTALLISADSDLVGPLKIIKEKHSQKRIIVFFPPNRFSANLKMIADAQLSLGHSLLSIGMYFRVYQMKRLEEQVKIEEVAMVG